MKGLALTSSTTHASLALGDGRQTWRKSHSTPRGHTEFMNVALQDVLKESGWMLQDLDVIAVDRGPGSFTGIRVSVNVARSLCYLLGKPCFISESLDLLAPAGQGFSVSLINGYKNLVFAAIFENGRRLEPSRVLSPEELEAWVESRTSAQPVQIVGDGWAAYETLWSDTFRKKIRRDSSASDFPEAGVLLERALHEKMNWIQDWNLISPLYLRESAAEEALYGSKDLGRRIR